MSASLALFALFTVGSAVAAPCGVNSVDSDLCTTSTNLIGSCTSAGACAPTTVTDACAVGADCTIGPWKGKCAATNKCKFVQFPCIASQSSTLPCTDTNNAIGKCDGTAGSRECKLSNTTTCTAQGQACSNSGLEGKCDSGKVCKYPFPAAQCAKLGAACDWNGFIGTCTGSNTSLTCTVPNKHGTCVTEGTACNEGTLQGLCMADQKCKYVPPVVACTPGDQPCADSYGFIGKCTGDAGNVKCTLADTCTKGASCHDGTSKLLGMCVHYNKCRYLPPVVSCGDQNDPCADGYGFIGQCNVSRTCAVKTDFITKGVCSEGAGAKKLSGISEEGSKCRYLPPVVPCAAIGTAPCADSYGFLGSCASGVCAVTNTCTPGVTCHDGTSSLPGMCVDGRKCKYIPLVAPCTGDSTTGDACTDSNNLIGTCAGGGATTCSPVQGCEKDTYCEKGMLKGMCNEAGNSCQYVPPMAPCAQTWGTGDGCTDSLNFLGKCGAWGTGGSMTCALSKCGLDSQKTCKEGSLTGKCVEGHNCKYAPPVAPCVLASVANADCTDSDGLIGQCIGPAGSRWCSRSNVACTADEACAGGTGTLTGTCLADNKCQAKAYLKVEYTVQPSEYKTPVVADVLTDTTKFREQLGIQMGRPVPTAKITCGVMPSFTNGSMTTCNMPGNSCTLACSDGSTHKVNGKNDLKCDEDTVQWKGSAGTCDRFCPARDSDFGALTPTGQLTKAVDGGTLTCQSQFPGAQCTLKCGPNYRVVTAPTQKCDGSETPPKWTTGTPGVCGHAVEISASVNVLLKDTDSHDLITKLDDDTFNDTFRDSVSKLTGLLPENVLIKKISLIKSASGRRLNQRSVQVDYSVQLGATDPEDDGRLPVGGGLRGIP